ncbi:hypothetical protein B0H17DRAFT_1190732 [Mycena rosella]|uniref:Uncharacterized protein n=1 Tax=Mycena rosella TaxID=1033263 RepID=A0AAD7H142_MYCRO|nr:hypothetical protein B0H17DRAFT_1190732 [Mycena rosella]
MSAPQDPLRAFLARPRTSDETHPPTIPPELGDLPGQVYLDLALEYIQSYPFARIFEAKARAYLTVRVNVDRSSLAAIADESASPYNAELEKQNFVHMVVFKRRWELEEVASEMLTPVELVRSETRTASSVTTPMTTGESRERTVPENVRDRDLKCRMTGVSREKYFYTPEEHE